VLVGLVLVAGVAAVHRVLDALGVLVEVGGIRPRGGLWWAGGAHGWHDTPDGRRSPCPVPVATA
jgi:hypothetical protein